MTQEEFENRAGLIVTSGEYRDIEAMYYAVPNMEKNEFCKCWRQCGNNPLTLGLTKQVTILNGMVEERNNEVDDCHDKLSELAEFLLGKACAYKDADFYNEAIRLIGKKEVVLRKIKMALPLWEEDMDYITMNLK